MSGGEFVDTNVLVYAFDQRTPEKQAAAIRLIARLAAERSGCLSLQVLQEFYVASVRQGMPGEAARTQLHRLRHWTLHRPTHADILAAIDNQLEHSISFWDALIVQSAVQLGCAVLWSEDLQHGRAWGGLTVRNPFVLE